MEGPSVGAFDFTLRLAVWRTGTALGADGYGLILGAMEEQGQQLPPGGPSWDRMSWSLVVLSNQVPPRPLNPPPPPFSGLLHRRPSRWWLRIQRRGRHPPPRKDGGSSRGTLLLRRSAPARAFVLANSPILLVVRRPQVVTVKSLGIGPANPAGEWWCSNGHLSSTLESSEAYPPEEEETCSVQAASWPPAATSQAFGALPAYSCLWEGGGSSFNGSARCTRLSASRPLRRSTPGHGCG